MPEIKQDLRTATMIVAANDSLHKNMANYVCDGVADDVEIQAALNAVAAGVGLVGRVILLDGSYHCTADITVPDSVTLEGQGYASRIYFGGAIIANAITIGGDYISVKNLAAYLDAGAGAGGTRPNVIYADNRDHIWLENLIVTGDDSVLDDGSDLRQCGVLFANGGYSKIINCKFEDNMRHGIHLNNCINCTVEGNTSTSNEQWGILLMNGADWCNVDGNNCDLNGHGGINVASCQHVTVTGNGCDTNTLHGILIYQSLDCTVTGNTCVDNDANGINVEDSSDRTVVVGNTCNDNDAIGNTYDGINVSESNELVITGNQCNGNGLHGIHIYRSSYCSITGNTCNRQGNGDGIHVEGDVGGDADYNNLTGNVCSANGDDGIALEGAGNANNNIVVANQLYDNTGTNLVNNGTDTELGHNQTAS